MNSTVAAIITGVGFEGLLDPPPRSKDGYIPTVGVTQKNGTALLAALKGGKTVEGVIRVDSIIENRTTYNIIAETVHGDENNVLAIGSHTDSGPATPGLNDNGSGTIGILEVALQLAKFRTNNAVRFLFWSAEEFDQFGSRYYIENLSAEELLKIRLYLNFDMIASPNYVYDLYNGDGSDPNVSGPPDSAEAKAFFTKWFESQGIRTTEMDLGCCSDYIPFMEAKIPVGGIRTGAAGSKTADTAAALGGTAGTAYDPNYEGPGDNYTNLNFDAFLTNTKAIAAAVAEYSNSFESIPLRTANGTI